MLIWLHLIFLKESQSVGPDLVGTGGAKLSNALKALFIEKALFAGVAQLVEQLTCNQ